MKEVPSDYEDEQIVNATVFHLEEMLRLGMSPDLKGMQRFFKEYAALEDNKNVSFVWMLKNMGPEKTIAKLKEYGDKFSQLYQENQGLPVLKAFKEAFF